MHSPEAKAFALRRFLQRNMNKVVVGIFIFVLLVWWFF